MFCSVPLPILKKEDTVAPTVKGIFESEIPLNLPFDKLRAGSLRKGEEIH